MREHFRGVQEWIDCGLKISDANDEVCKYYDAAISNLISFGCEKSYGSSDEIVDKLNKIASECVLVQALMTGSSLLSGRNIYYDEDVKKKVEAFLNLADKKTNSLTKREKKHVAAVKYYSEGDIDNAFLAWDSILIDHPTDVHASFISFFAMFAIGASREMMHLYNRVTPFFTKNVPLEEYVHGIQAFCCEEGGNYPLAEKLGLKCIEDTPYVGFAYHGLAHVYEMTRKFEKGKNLMLKNYENWKGADVIASHILWHTCLFYTEMCDYEGAVELFDTELKPYLGPNNFLAYSDASSLFYRLKMAGYDVGKERWRELNSNTDHYIDSVVRPFHGSHIIMTSLASDDAERADKMLKTIYDVNHGKMGIRNASVDKIGNSLLDGIVKFHQQDYDEATELFKPIRHHIYRIGGSHAQRDVYEQMICYSALNSKSTHNQNYARQLMAERQACLPSPLTDHMASKLLAFHYANE